MRSLLVDRTLPVVASGMLVLQKTFAYLGLNFYFGTKKTEANIKSIFGKAAPRPRPRPRPRPTWAIQQRSYGRLLKAISQSWSLFFADYKIKFGSFPSFSHPMIFIWSNSILFMGRWRCYKAVCQLDQYIFCSKILGSIPVIIWYRGRTDLLSWGLSV